MSGSSGDILAKSYDASVLKAQLTVQVAARCHRLLLHTICRWRKTTREDKGTQSRRRPIEIVSLELFSARCGAAPAKAGVCWEGEHSLVPKGFHLVEVVVCRRVWRGRGHIRSVPAARPCPLRRGALPA